MSHQRLYLLLSLLCIHAALVALGGTLPEVIAPGVAGTVYLPLWLLQTIGLHVFSRAEAGGWSAPSVLGWLLVAATWTALWWILVVVITKVRA